MYTYRRLRYATHWNHRLALILVAILLLAVSWRTYHAWQRAHPQSFEQCGQLA